MTLLSLENDLHLYRNGNGPYDDDAYIATCQDAVEGNLTSRIDTVSTVDLTTAGTYTVTYTCADDAGNPPSSLVRNVTVVDDNTPPTITIRVIHTDHEVQTYKLLKVTMTLYPQLISPQPVHTLLPTPVQTTGNPPSLS